MDAGALDAVCFHAQQAAEKLLKAYLTAFDVHFPFVHNLEQLVDICADHDETFGEIRETAQRLTPFAVGARYDEDFWPALNTAREAARQAGKIRAFVLSKLPTLGNQ
ncbi:MAG: HEPN domain-containing protein [Lentisphaerae bacterium]|nr:HEPN domain-containing protein [Lentisphaerota bacterium]